MNRPTRFVASAIVVAVVASAPLSIRPSESQSTERAAPSSRRAASSAPGPLKVSASNPRYFSDPTGRTVYLTGSHTWNNFQDAGTVGRPPDDAFDYEAYLDSLRAWNHNFIRLWSYEGWEWGAAWVTPPKYYEPLPYPRVGPDLALDDKPKFDLDRFDQAYFDRLRARVIAARDRGLYVAIMLFQGWSVETPAAWRGHPFNAGNNVNGVDGDPSTKGTGLAIYTLHVPDITARQRAYVRKVIDSVNDLDNVLYEVANEIGGYSTNWQYHIADYVKAYEATQPRQHPVGMTFQASGLSPGRDATLFRSPAEWISPGEAAPPYDWRTNPPPADGSKVILTDTDHFDPRSGTAAWAWKSFLRGHNPILMDNPRKSGTPRDGARLAMGQTLLFADRIDLGSMVPRDDLASSRYCLAKDGAEYLVYVPADAQERGFFDQLQAWFGGSPGPAVTVDLAAASGRLAAEWFNPATGATTAGETTSGGARRSFRAPFEGDAVLHIVRDATTP